MPLVTQNHFSHQVSDRLLSLFGKSVLYGPSMAKSDRLLQMMQCLRTFPPPVKAQALSEELGVSLRTIYRDIDSLRRSGALIDGEAGYGYTLQEDPALPPMMFSRDEMESIVLGLREVEAGGRPGARQGRRANALVQAQGVAARADALRVRARGALRQAQSIAGPEILPSTSPRFRASHTRNEQDRRDQLPCRC